MQTVICAAFSAKGDAEGAYTDLIQVGACREDLTILSHQVAEASPEAVDDGRLDVPESASDDSDSTEPRPEGASPEPPDQPDLEGFPSMRTPFGEVPTGPSLFVTIDKPGDLVPHLMEIGMGMSISRALENVIIAGGAILLARTPTGLVDDILAEQIMQQCGGTGVARSERGPYML